MSDVLGTVQLFKAAGISRMQLFRLRDQYADQFPTPARVGPSLLWPASTLEVVKRLIEQERRASEEVSK